MTRHACKICVLTKGITLRDTFATEDELLDHVQKEHGHDAVLEHIQKEHEARERLSADRCFILPNGECVSPFDCPHGPASPLAIAALNRLGETVPTPRGLLALGTATTAHIPVSDAEEIAHKRGLKQVILVAWDGAQEHVVTFGTTLGDADNAAQGGNLVKTALNWPPSRYSTSARVATLVEHANALLDRIVQMGMEPLAGHTYWREVASLRDFLVAEGLRS